MKPQTDLMPLYRCHKQVRALKIKALSVDAPPKFKDPTCKGCFALHTACGHCERCDWERNGGGTSFSIVPEDPACAPFPIDAEYMRSRKPVAGGYYVVYEDGYESFSPAKAFEDGYTRV